MGGIAFGVGSDCSIEMHSTALNTLRPNQQDCPCTGGLAALAGVSAPPPRETFAQELASAFRPSLPFCNGDALLTSS